MASNGNGILKPLRLRVVHPNLEHIFVLVPRVSLIANLKDEIKKTLEKIFPCTNQHEIIYVMKDNGKALLPDWYPVDPLLKDNEEICISYRSNNLDCIQCASLNRGHNSFDSVDGAFDMSAREIQFTEHNGRKRKGDETYHTRTVEEKTTGSEEEKQYLAPIKKLKASESQNSRKKELKISKNSSKMIEHPVAVKDTFTDGNASIQQDDNENVEDTKVCKKLHKHNSTLEQVNGCLSLVSKSDMKAKSTSIMMLNDTDKKAADQIMKSKINVNRGRSEEKRDRSSGLAENFSTLKGKEMEFTLLSESGTESQDNNHTSKKAKSKKHKKEKKQKKRERSRKKNEESFETVLNDSVVTGSDLRESGIGSDSTTHNAEIKKAKFVLKCTDATIDFKNENLGNNDDPNPHKAKKRPKREQMSDALVSSEVEPKVNCISENASEESRHKEKGIMIVDVQFLEKGAKNKSIALKEKKSKMKSKLEIEQGSNQAEDLVSPLVSKAGEEIQIEPIDYSKVQNASKDNRGKRKHLTSVDGQSEEKDSIDNLMTVNGKKNKRKNKPEKEPSNVEDAVSSRKSELRDEEIQIKPYEKDEVKNASKDYQGKRKHMTSVDGQSEEKDSIDNSMTVKERKNKRKTKKEKESYKVEDVVLSKKSELRNERGTKIESNDKNRTQDALVENGGERKATTTVDGHSQEKGSKGNSMPVKEKSKTKKSKLAKEGKKAEDLVVSSIESELADEDDTQKEPKVNETGQDELSACDSKDREAMSFKVPVSNITHYTEKANALKNEKVNLFENGHKKLKSVEDDFQVTKAQGNVIEKPSFDYETDVETHRIKSAVNQVVKEIVEESDHSQSLLQEPLTSVNESFKKKKLNGSNFEVKSSKALEGNEKKKKGGKSDGENRMAISNKKDESNITADVRNSLIDKKSEKPKPPENKIVNSDSDTSSISFSDYDAAVATKDESKKVKKASPKTASKATGAASESGKKPNKKADAQNNDKEVPAKDLSSKPKKSKRRRSNSSRSTRKSMVKVADWLSSIADGSDSDVDTEIATVCMDGAVVGEKECKMDSFVVLERSVIENGGENRNVEPVKDSSGQLMHDDVPGVKIMSETKPQVKAKGSDKNESENAVGKSKYDGGSPSKQQISETQDNFLSPRTLMKRGGAKKGEIDTDKNNLESSIRNSFSKEEDDDKRENPKKKNKGSSKKDNLDHGDEVLNLESLFDDGESIASSKIKRPTQSQPTSFVQKSLKGFLSSEEHQRFQSKLQSAKNTSKMKTHSLNKTVR